VVLKLSMWATSKNRVTRHFKRIYRIAARAGTPL